MEEPPEPSDSALLSLLAAPVWQPGCSSFVLGDAPALGAALRVCGVRSTLAANQRSHKQLLALKML